MKITKLDNGNGDDSHQTEEHTTETPEAVETSISTDPGDGLSQGLTQYPGATDQGSK